jgi:hypothetical protein
MIRSLARTFKHLVYAVLTLIVGVCVLEVALRGRSLYQSIHRGPMETQDDSGFPCPVAYRVLLPRSTLTHRSAESGRSVEIRLNNFGLRGPDIVVPKPAGVFRIVCLGDESTLGWDVAEEDAFPRQLERLLAEQVGSPIEVINAAQPGHCPLLSLAWSKYRLLGLQADLVILCCHVNDPADDRRYRPLARFADNGCLIAVGHPAAGSDGGDVMGAVQREFLLVRHTATLLEKSLLVDRADSEPVDLWMDPPEQSSPTSGPLRQAWEPLAELRELCAAIPADFVAAVVPNARLESGGSRAGPTNELAASITSGTGRSLQSTDLTVESVAQLAFEAERLKIPFLEASRELARLSPADASFVRSSGELSAAGHGLFARILAAALLERAGHGAGPHSPQGPVSPEQPPAAIPAGWEVQPATSSSQPAPSPLPTTPRRRRPVP